MPKPPSQAVAEQPKCPSPYKVQVEYLAQEAVSGGWHDVAGTDDLDNVAAMLATARRRWEVSWETGRRGPVEIRLVRRVTTWQTYPEPAASLSADNAQVQSS